MADINENKYNSGKMKRLFSSFIKWNKSLRIRVPLILAIVPFVLAILMIFITVRLFNDRIVNENVERAGIMTRVLAESIDGDSIDRYLDTLEKDDDYYRVMDLIYAMYRKSDVTYLYVARFTEEGAYNIFDADDNEETFWELGYFYDWVEGSSFLSRETITMLANGLWPERDISYSEWGWLLTVYEPIYRSDGSITAFACADISMDMIIYERQVITTTLILSILLIMAITVLINIAAVQRMILKPVNALVGNVQDYQSLLVSSGALPEQAEEEEQLSGNELEVLQKLLSAMQSHIDKGFSGQAKALAFHATTLETLFDSIPDHIFVKDKNLRYLMCNKSLAEFYDRSKEEIIGKNDADGIGVSDEVMNRFNISDCEVLSKQKTIVVEESIINDDGSEELFESIKAPLIVDGKAVGILGIARDITRRKVAEREREADYQASKELADALAEITKSHDFTAGNLSAVSALVAETGCRVLNTSRAGIWRVDIDEKVLKNLFYYNKSTQEHTVESDIDVSDSEEYLELLKTERLIITSDVRVPNPMSALFEKYYGADIRAVLDAPVRIGGRLVGVICIEQDKTDDYAEGREWTIEEQNFASSLADFVALTLESTERRTLAQRTELMMNRLPGMVYQAYNNPPDFTPTFLSEGCFELTGYTREELMGDNPVKLLDLVHPEDAPEFIKMVTETLLAGLPLETTYRTITKDGTEKWVWNRSHVADFDKDGKPRLLEGFYTDITEQRRLEAAESASRAKSDFLSNMSHEMRTPLNAIIGMTAIGNRAGDIDGKTHALNKIGDASSHLLGMVNDILDMAKIEANKLELIPVEFHFEHMIDRVLTVVHFRADEKNQRLTVNLDGNIPRYLIGDDQRLSQVLINILWNAVKFTKQDGKVQLDISVSGKTEKTCKLRAEITDDGIGISPEQQQKLFNTFEQADSDTSRVYGGTGLGLTIAKSIVEMMGGEIWVESELGKGAKFIFTVMLECVTAGKHSSDELSTAANEDGDIIGNSLAGKRLLVAEDVEINREILVALLDGSGLLIDCAENGKEAVDMVIADPEKYDMILMDLQMPQMDGLEATKIIRSLPPRQGKRLPIVALTANVFKDDIDACLEAGMDDHIGKPLDIDKVNKKLREYLLD